MAVLIRGPREPGRRGILVDSNSGRQDERTQRITGTARTDTVLVSPSLPSLSSLWSLFGAAIFRTMDESFSIQPLALDADRRHCARIMSSSEPWLTLGRSYESSYELLDNPTREVYVAKA